MNIILKIFNPLFRVTRLLSNGTKRKATDPIALPVYTLFTIGKKSKERKN